MSYLVRNGHVLSCLFSRDTKHNLPTLILRTDGRLRGITLVFLIMSLDDMVAAALPFFNLSFR